MLRRGWVPLGVVASSLALVAAACGGSGGSRATGDLAAPLVRQAGGAAVAAAESRPEVADLPSTTAPEPVTTTTTSAPARATSAAPAGPPPAARPQAGPWSLEVYRGLGTWVDVYDWSATFTRQPAPAVGAADVDRMAAAGVQTLFIQTGKWDAPADVLEPERLLPIITRARDRGMAVVAWYLPTLEDPATDLRRLLAAAALPVDGLAVDIESSKVADVAERNRRLLWLSAELRRSLPGRTIGAIPYPPVLLDVINPRLWPDFPWRALAPHYDVWLPMSYQSFRTTSSGYRDAYRYAGENIDRVRIHLQWLDAPVHVIGGIADRTGHGDVAGLHRAVTERAAIGASLYDWRTTHPDLWASLAAFRK